MSAFNALKHALLELKQPEGVFLSLSFSLPSLSLLGWLKAQTHYPQIYLSDKDDQGEVAAIGQAWHTDQAEIPNDIHKARLYGGMGFSSHSIWPNFPHCQFVLPRLEIRRQGRITKLVCNLYWATSDFVSQVNTTLALLDSLNPAEALAKQSILISQRQDTPNKQDWRKLVEQVTDDDFQQLTAKVVLSRRTQLTSLTQVDQCALLHQWQMVNPNCFQFLFSFSPDSHFIGCTPERLYLRSGARLTTESLAGTMPRGATTEADEKLSYILLHDQKIKRENQLVLDDILAQLSKVSLDIGLDKIGILKLNQLQHLKQRIHAYLKPDASDHDLLNALHPTPAVGGTPRKSALAFIEQNEPYPRGWYAGAIGILSQQQSQFAVAIRSALIQHNQIALFAGAGIVKGSDPELEWQELEHKIATPLSLLQLN
ncbi:isochorismate synthase [Motilimonas cestriensis]|uniref:Isochorismate synthase MenF n=1 Tax=Motilimonas cestriensis TaxID=2742685 RepID=A0ABS8W8L3_9GAMM|nr:isochorismate synthase [Motilimonas cestriensis]MCE2594093.1 isochorismate synthase [Motilimonas cestriensis]